ncbi:MAG: prepilin-type N-terminal cleavage/methylation domain-containing protein [Candidatus Omnitrophota bacterium]
MRAKSRDNSGFTLIEITLVVLIMAIMTAVGLPNFRELYERSDMKAAAAEFLGALRYAQQRSAMERMPIRIVIDVDKQTYWVPVEQEKERRHYKTRRSQRRTNPRAENSRRRKPKEIKEVHGILPKGYIFEFVYKVAADREIRRGEGEFFFYPDGSADAAYFTLLRVAKKRDDERRVFLKISPASGVIKSLEGTTLDEGSDFYRGYYDGYET